MDVKPVVNTKIPPPLETSGECTQMQIIMFIYVISATLSAIKNGSFLVFFISMISPIISILILKLFNFCNWYEWATWITVGLIITLALIEILKINIEKNEEDN